MTVISDGSLAFVTSYGSNEMLIIDTDPVSPYFHTQVGVVQVGDSPNGVVFQSSPVAVAYVSNKADDTISVIGVVEDYCEGDFDEDGDVDGSDLAIFAADFGRTDCSTACEGDFDTDNDVDGSDLAVFAADFGRTDCPIRP